MSDAEQKNYWNTSIENEVKRIGEQSKGYKIIHIRNSKKAKKCNSILMYLGIFLGPLSSFILGIKELRNPDSISPEELISMCVGLLCGMVMSTIKHAKYEKISSAHKIAASKYSSLENNIRRQLLKDRKVRIEASKYLEYIGESYDELFNSSPLVEDKIYEDYVEMARKIGISVPDEYGVSMNINQNYVNEKVCEISNVSEIKMYDDNEERSILFHHPVNISKTRKASKDENETLNSGGISHDGKSPDGESPGGNSHGEKSPDGESPGGNSHGEKSPDGNSPGEKSPDREISYPNTVPNIVIENKVNGRVVEYDKSSPTRDIKIVIEKEDSGNGKPSFVRKASNVTTIPEFGKFSDNKMNYELARLLGFR